MRKTGPFSQYNRHIAWYRPQDQRSERSDKMQDGLEFHESLLAGFAAQEAKVLVYFAVLAGATT